ncbi:response regulator [Alteromonas sp. C1M14]|uniref:response regulator n=1 Tax=Alteromonas sp. C1M14 TaxID=2841567 RepID=UPI001C09C24C|nr:response regulator [Alteromonas sp. C1M14]MBU2979378.1 response regulator [Alteromonas sp. C1M14]
MIEPPLPPDEEGRLAELLSYRILDTDSEKLLDDITQLASQICETPIALISLVDPDRQWFKSKVGIDVEQTHRNISFCGHAILDQSLFEINDTLNDERFADNPLVTGAPNIRFYAGTPLITPNGYALGTLCTIDSKPKALSDLQKSALHTLGCNIVTHLELRKRNAELNHLNNIKTDYLASFSHELRTPLNAICTFGKLLEEEARLQHLAPIFQDALRHIRVSGNKLLAAVDIILGKEDNNGSKTLNTVGAHAFFHHIFHTLENHARGQGIQISSHIENIVPETLTFNTAGFCKLMLTVLGYAFRHAAPNMHIDIMLYYRLGDLIILIKDTHSHFTLEDQQGVYACVDDTLTGASYLTKLRILVDNLGGHIKIKSSEQNGTVYMCSLPATTEEPMPSPSQAKSCFTDNPAILVVEDNEINQEVMKSLLGQHSLIADIASDGEAALRMLETRQYDLIFMDINLPGICGLETTQKIRETLPSIPVIAVTANVITDKETMREAGMDAVLTKPIEQASLARVLNLYLIPGGKID